VTAVLTYRIVHIVMLRDFALLAQPYPQMMMRLSRDAGTAARWM
jgi:hypothetical protein